MENTLFIALSRQMTVRRQMEVVANNLANANTAGYKGEQLMFVEYLAKSGNGIGEQNRMYFVQDLATARNQAPGEYRKTGGDLDFAIRGPGWFTIDTPEGERFTRDGTFRLDQDDQLVTQDGHPVLGVGGPIVFQTTDRNIELSGDGTLRADGEERGRLLVTEFENPHTMRKAAGNLYLPGADGREAEESTVVQGMIEGSNVKAILEISEMMQALRTYQSAGKMIETEHDRQRRTIDRLTRTET